MINNDLITKIVFQQKGEKIAPILTMWLACGPSWGSLEVYQLSPLSPVDLVRQKPMSSVCCMKQGFTTWVPKGGTMLVPVQEPRLNNQIHRSVRPTHSSQFCKLGVLCSLPQSLHECFQQCRHVSWASVSHLCF